MRDNQFFKLSLTGWNTEFSFSNTCYHTKVKKPSLSYYLPITGWGKNSWINSFLKGNVKCQLVTVSIFYNYSHYTTSDIYIYICHLTTWLVSKYIWLVLVFSDFWNIFSFFVCMSREWTSHCATNTSHITVGLPLFSYFHLMFVWSHHILSNGF